MKTPLILVVITARGGSKGVFKKNIRDVAGEPLISYAIRAALGVGDDIYKVIVSTDNDEIANVARRYGAQVPFMRPPELATDVAASLPVVQHAVLTIEQLDNIKIDWSILIQPTNPLLTTDDLIRGIELINKDATSIVSVVDGVSSHPLKALKVEDGYLKPYINDAPQAIRRQDLDPVYKRNGAFYITRRDVLIEQNDLYGDYVKPCIMGEDTALDIDTEYDLKLADFILRNK